MTISSQTLIQRFNMIFMEDLNITELYKFREEAQTLYKELFDEASGCTLTHPEYAADLFVESNLYTRMISKINVELKARKMYRVYHDRKYPSKVVRFWLLVKALFAKKAEA